MNAKYLILIILLSTSVCLANDIEFEVTVSKERISLDEAIQLSLIFRNSREVPAPELPEIDGFKSRYIGPSTLMSIRNGKTSESITHMYLLIPQKPGKFQIGPITVTHKGVNYTSEPVEVEVVKGPVPEEKPPQRRQPQFRGDAITI